MFEEKDKRYCTECGNKLKEDFLFCNKCGIRLEDSEGNKNILTFKIPGILGKTIEFSDSFVRTNGYGGTEIYYKDVTGLSYHVVKRYVNLVPMGTFYYFTIKGINREINLDFVENKGNNDLFIRILYVLEKMIKPILLRKLISVIEEDKYFDISSVAVTKDGLLKKRFLRKDKFLAWKDYSFNNISEGFLRIYVKNENTNRLFCSLALSELNVVMLPDLINFYVNKKK